MVYVCFMFSLLFLVEVFIKSTTTRSSPLKTTRTFGTWLKGWWNFWSSLWADSKSPQSCWARISGYNHKLVATGGQDQSQMTVMQYWGQSQNVRNILSCDRSSCFWMNVVCRHKGDAFFGVILEYHILLATFTNFWDAVGSGNKWYVG